MATLEKIRNRMGVLVAVVIGLALLAFVLGDLFRGGGSAIRGDRYEIAEIGGTSISYQNFQKEVEELVEINKISQNQSALDADTREQLRQQVWERIIREHVMNEEYEELGIGVSSQELWDMVQGENIHPMIQRIFTNPETGEVNNMQIIRFLKSYNQDPTGRQRTYWLYLEDQMIRERKFTKFSNLINKSLYLTSSESNQLAELNARNVDFNYVLQRFNSIADSMVEVDESELKDYYDNHEQHYKQSASRDLEYVTFSIEPTEKDIKGAREYIVNSIEDFKNARETAEFVNLNSDISFDDTYYKKEELSDSIADFMFSADIGDTYGPYREEGAFKLSKLTDVKYLPDSVKARHILIQPNRRQRNIQNAKNLADSLEQELEQGADFGQLAQQYSDDQNTAQDGGNLGWIQEGDMVEAITDTAFFAQPGEIKLVQSQYGFHLLEVTERGRETKKVQVATLARNIEPSSETYQQVYSRASRFAGELRSYESFTEAIQENDLTKKMANNVQINSSSIPGLEDARNIIRAAYDTKENKLITNDNGDPIFEIGDNFVVGFVTEIRKKGIAPFEQVKNDIRVNVMENKKAEKIKSQFNENMQNAGSLEEVSDQMNLRIMEANDVNYSTYRIPGAGSEPKIVGAAMELEENQLSYPIQGENGVYLIQVTNTTESQSTNPSIVKQRELQRMQRMAPSEVFTALREAADIKDKRYKFY
ncbi:MAG: SurA N-terminal domain-containing protein [Bacteroidales bacterium]|nr:SurA N-terminal domain-containing protein [Bacteroidales bacterium]